ncbi:MAG: hypothetical protein ABR540_10595, partial [Acidimicrobiales bacterium]
ISELMPHWDGGECGPVQDRLRQLAGAKLDDARSRITELQAFTADLQRFAATFGSYTAEGPCDADCGCVSEGAPRRVPVSSAPESLTKRPGTAGPPEIACGLEPSQVPDRVRDWQSLLGHVARRKAVDGGLRLEFGDGAPMADLAQLVAAEQSCCRFFDFAITVDDRGVGLEVCAPEDGQPILHSLFGAA